MLTESGLESSRTGRTWTGATAIESVPTRMAWEGLASFAALPSNVKALEAAELFACGLVPFVALVGPSGWGKSKLLAAIASAVSTRERCPCPVYLSVESLLATMRLDQRLPLLIDNAQDVARSLSGRQRFRLALERRVKAGKPTLLAFTEPLAPRLLHGFLPHTRKWLLARIDRPDVAERVVLVRHLAESVGLLLADPLVRFIAHHVAGTGHALRGAIHRLRLVGNRWIEPAEVLRACGILQPHLSDETGFDLRDHVSDVVSGVWAERRKRAGDRNDPVDLSVYLMLHLMGLNEVEVAAYFDLAPGEAFSTAQRVSLGYRNGSCRCLVNECVHELFRSLEWA